MDFGLLGLSLITSLFSDYSSELDMLNSSDSEVQTCMYLMIMDLFEKGYNTEEVIDMIDELNPEGMETLSEEEKDNIRDDARRMIRKKIIIKERNKL